MAATAVILATTAIVVRGVIDFLISFKTLSKCEGRVFAFCGVAFCLTIFSRIVKLYV